MVDSHIQGGRKKLIFHKKKSEKTNETNLLSWRHSHLRFRLQVVKIAFFRQNIFARFPTEIGQNCWKQRPFLDPVSSEHPVFWMRRLRAGERGRKIYSYRLKYTRLIVSSVSLFSYLKFGVLCPFSRREPSFFYSLLFLSNLI